MNKNIWFTSDTHYGHKNICRGVADWEDKSQCRDFDTIEEMNQALVDNINKNIKEDDVLYHLGDWSFGGIENIWKFRRQIKCKNIHLILGNHDHHIEGNKLFTLPHTLEERTLYVSLTNNRGEFMGMHGDGILARIPALFRTVEYYKEIEIEKQKIILSHYAMRVWNHSHKGSWMLYGHSHGTLDAMTPEIANPTWIGDQYYIKNYKTMDVGVDTNKLLPYNFEDLRVIMNKREVSLNVDHHNKNTN